MKKVLSLILSVIMILSCLVCVTSYAEDDIKVTINGQNLTMDQPPVLISDRTLVPVRAIFEALGAKVDWNNDTNTATGVLGETTVEIQIENTNAKVNGKDVILDVPAKLISDRTLVPVRFISESLGAKVDWNNDTQTVIITTDASNEKISSRKIDFDTLTSFEVNKDYIAGGELDTSSVSISSDYDHTSGNGKSLKLGNIKVNSNRMKILNLLSDTDMGKKFEVTAWVLSPESDAKVNLGIYSLPGTENAFSPVATTSKEIKKGEWTQIKLKYTYQKSGLDEIGIDQASNNFAKILYIDDVTVEEMRSADEPKDGVDGAVEISEKSVKFVGRTDKFVDGYPFNWIASGIEFEFTGKNASVYVSRVSDEETNKYFAVFADGKNEYKRILITKPGWYKLFENDLDDGNHSVKFIRSSEGNGSSDGVMLKYVKAENIKPALQKQRKIEFIGDSYTSGYGNLELGGSKKTPENTDGCLGYAYVASQMLSADANIESVSGAGATMNYATSSTKNVNNTMPKRVVNSTLVISTMSETSPWDYSKFTPQVVVVFLGTNDYNGTKPSGSDPEFFSNGYKEFLLYLRKNYPNATIIGCSKQSGCYQDEAKAVIEGLGDKKIIHFTFTKFSGQAVNGHPYYTADREMAQELVEKINSIEGIWN